MRKPIRRLVVGGLFAVVLGAATSIGIAWWLALREVQTYTFNHVFKANIAAEGEQPYFAPFRFSDENRPGYRRIEIEAMDKPLNRRGALLISDDLNRIDRTPRRNVPPGGTAQPPQRPLWFPWLGTPAADEIATIWAARASGWPRLCMRSTRVQLEGQSQTRIVGALELKPPASYKRWAEQDRGRVPLLPIWSGLVVNTMVFGAMWLAPVLVALMLRAGIRAKRRKRGGCSNCGYDRSGLGLDKPCPECGRVPVATGAGMQPESS